MLTGKEEESAKGRLTGTPLWADREIRRFMGLEVTQIPNAQLYLEHAACPLGYLVPEYQVRSHHLIEFSIHHRHPGIIWVITHVKHDCLYCRVRASGEWLPTLVNIPHSGSAMSAP